MKINTSAIALLLVMTGISAVHADMMPAIPSLKMEMHGTPANNGKIADLSVDGLTALPLSELSKAAQSPVLEATAATRSANDVQLYRTIAPSVVYVLTKEGLGSGSLLDTSGDILTNWHVVKGYEYVAVIFKPAVESSKPTRDDMKLARVVKYDEISDLALIKASEVPTGRSPIRLGNSGEIAVGMDVHAIGHPEGESWTYTTGIISQYREGFAWQDKEDAIKHKADIIQTQTPINPGNSGGPLLTDSGDLIGVNAFKDASAEGLNFAVSVDEVRRFLAHSGNRTVQVQTSQRNAACKVKKLATFRNAENNATVTSFDFFCTGKDSAEYVVPDDKSQAIFLRLDRNGDGRADAIIFDLQRRGRWDLSFWDENFTGQWTLVGYHDDGTLKPTRFESYAEFQRRIASR